MLRTWIAIALGVACLVVLPARAEMMPAPIRRPPPCRGPAEWGAITKCLAALDPTAAESQQPATLHTRTVGRSDRSGGQRMYLELADHKWRLVGVVDPQQVIAGESTISVNGKTLPRIEIRRVVPYGTGWLRTKTAIICGLPDEDPVDGCRQIIYDCVAIERGRTTGMFHGELVAHAGVTLEPEGDNRYGGGLCTVGLQ